MLLTGSSYSEALFEDVDTQWVQEHVFTLPAFYHVDFETSYYNKYVLTTTSSSKPVNVSLTIPGVGYEIRKTITKASIPWEIDLSRTRLDSFDIRMLPGIGKQNKTIIVRSSDVVNVHVISNDYGAGDGFVVTPTNQLGTKYYVASYRPFLKYFPAIVCITALYMNTSVYVRTKVLHMEITLVQYESYRFDGGEKEDLSGTLVQSNKPIVVISGVRTIVHKNVENLPKFDGLLVQLPPTNMWGENFNIVPFQNSTVGYLYRVLTLNISTSLNMSNGKVIEIGPEVGSFYEADVTEDEVLSFKSDQPVMVVQFVKGDNAQSPPRGDPAMLIVPPITHYGHNVTFPVFQFWNAFKLDHKHTHFISVIAECTAFDGGLKLDDAEVNWHQQNATNSTMCYASREVLTGAHSIIHTDPMVKFYVSVYGICETCDSSYAYSANAYYFKGKYFLIKS